MQHGMLLCISCVFKELVADLCGEEANAFEKEELHKIIVAMRHWDEAAKVKGPDA